MIESIYRHLSMGKDPKKAAYDGTKEVASAIIASTLTTVSVFLPIVFLSGLIGNLFSEFALTVSFSLAASLLVAVTVVPMLASRWLKAPKEDLEARRMESPFMQAIDSSIRWVLTHRVTVILLTLLMLGVGGYGLVTVGTELIPQSDEGMFTIDVELEHGTSLERTNETIEDIEEKLNDYSEVLEYVSTVGSSDDNRMMGGGSGSMEDKFLFQ